MEAELLNIGDLLKNIDYIDIKGKLDKDIIDITNDSRLASDKKAFIAIKGFRTDGHKFIDGAIKNGGKIVFYQEDLDNYLEDILYIKLKDTRKSLAKISAEIFNRPSKDFSLVGITGTNGKTTTTYMLENILNYNNMSTASIGTIGVKLNGRNLKTNHTTPESNELQKIFSQIRDEKIKVCVMEVSSHALDLNRVDESEFDYGIFTNLSLEHMDFHENMENYYQAKKKLFYMTKKSNLVNTDDKYGERLYRELKEDKKIVKSFGLNKDCDYRGENINASMVETNFDFITPEGKRNMTMPISVIYNVYNGISAMAIAMEMGLTLDEVVEAMENYGGAKGRYEVVENEKDLNIVIDFAHTPDAYENLLEFVSKNVDGKIYFVFGVNGDRTVEIRESMGEIAGKYADNLVITSDDPNYDTYENISNDILNGVKKSENTNYILIKNREEAIKWTLEKAKKEDLVLLVGKGHEMFMKYNGEKIPYDERKVVEKILSEID